jgi:hypothetical protein
MQKKPREVVEGTARLGWEEGDQQWKRRGLNAPWSNKENEIRVIFTGSVVSSLFFETNIQQQQQQLDVWNTIQDGKRAKGQTYPSSHSFHHQT